MVANSVFRTILPFDVLDLEGVFERFAMVFYPFIRAGISGNENAQDSNILIKNYTTNSRAYKGMKGQEMTRMRL